jgi:pyrroline-5-carboxylate reductase
VVEVHDEAELECALEVVEADVIGINNRDLTDFSVDLDRTFELLGRSGRLVAIDEKLIDVAMALISVAPAYVALISECWIDAVVGRGMPADQAAAMVAEAIAGSAELLIANDMDTLRTRRAVTTPGGVTAPGLDALERAGIRAAFRDAVDAVVDHRP